MKKTRWVWVGLLVALAVGGILSVFASPAPDGLERVAEDKGFIAAATDRPIVSGLVADYLFPGVKNDRLATGLAGFVGTSLLFLVGYGIGRVLLHGKTKRS